MKEFAVLYEQGPTSWSAYVPDLPICVAVGDSLEEVQGLIAESINIYIDTLKQDGEPIPDPVTKAGCVSVAA